MDLGNIIGAIVALGVFVGLPVLWVCHARRLGRMTSQARLIHHAEVQRWLEEEIEETSNPCSPRYVGIRHDDD